jgi:hypothetical protein
VGPGVNQARPGPGQGGSGAVAIMRKHALVTRTAQRTAGETAVEDRGGAGARRVPRGGETHPDEEEVGKQG